MEKKKGFRIAAGVIMITVPSNVLHHCKYSHICY